MRTRAALVCLVVMLAACFAAPALADQTVFVRDSSYQPSQVTIGAGETVTWSHDDGSTPHTVTSDDPSAEDFDSDPNNRCPTTRTEGCLGQGGSPQVRTFSHKFNNPGSFSYHCRVHSFMHASVVVLSRTPSPSPTPAPTAAPAPTPTSGPAQPTLEQPTVPPSGAATRTPSPRPRASPTPTASARRSASPSPSVSPSVLTLPELATAAPLPTAELETPAPPAPPSRPATSVVVLSVLTGFLVAATAVALVLARRRPRRS
jgi:plastocyanin